MKNLLIATDFTSASDIALKAGARLAELSKLETTFFHWDTITPRIKNMDMLPDLSGLYTESADWGKQVPKHIAKDLADQFQRSETKAEGKFEIVEGSSFEEVESFLNGHEDPMVIVSNSQVDKLSKILFGSFVEKVIFRTSQNVFIAKKEVNEIKKIGVCFDPVQDCDNLIDQAIIFAKQVGAEIDIIHVESFDSREIYKNVFATEIDVEKQKNDYMGYQRKLVTAKFEEYKKLIEDQGVKCGLDLVITVDKAPAENLLSHLKENPLDVIFVEPNAGFMDTFRFNSTSYDLIKHIPTNFVIIKEKA